MNKTKLAFVAVIFISLLGFFQLIIPGCAYAATGEIPIDNPNIIWSPYGWVKASDSTYRQSPTVGAYIDVAFTGNTLGLNLDISMLVPPVNPTNIRVVAYIDDNPIPVFRTLGDVSGNKLIFSSSLDDHTHYSRIILSGNTNTGSRWSYSGGQPISILRITGLQIDSSAEIININQTPLNKNGPRIIYYGDSISEGNGAMGTYGDTSNVAVIGNALNAHYGMHGYNSLNWWLSVSSSTSDFYYPVSDTINYPSGVWNNYYKGESLLNNPSLANSGYKDGTPDAVFNNLGMNDVSLYDISPPFGGATALNKFTNHISEWLFEVRTSLGARPAIFMVMPFNYNCTTTSNPSYDASKVLNLQLYRQAWLNTINNYVANSGDSRVYIIDLGESACDTIVENSSDGFHPNPTGAKIIGERIADQSRSNIILDTPFTVLLNGQPLTNNRSLISRAIYTGTAPAYSAITVSAQPHNYMCVTTANIEGNWSCSLDEFKKSGDYKIIITALTSYKQTYQLDETHLTVNVDGSLREGSVMLAKTGNNQIMVFIVGILLVTFSTMPKIHLIKH